MENQAKNDMIRSKIEEDICCLIMASLKWYICMEKNSKTRKFFKNDIIPTCKYNVFILFKKYVHKFEKKKQPR